jgi:hypothetical protein
MYLCFYTAVKISACFWFMRTETCSSVCYDIKVLYWITYFRLFVYDKSSGSFFEKYDWKANITCGLHKITRTVIFWLSTFLRNKFNCLQTCRRLFSEPGGRRFFQNMVCLFSTTHCTLLFKAYCAIWVRRSKFRLKASPRVSPRESTQPRKVKLWAKNVR